MKQVGITIDGMPVFGDIAKMYFQDGFPLCFIFDRIRNLGGVVSWVYLYEDMIKNGMTHKRVIHLLNEHIFECYGKEYKNYILQKLNTLYNYEH